VSDFIEVFEHGLASGDCALLVERFQRSREAERGRTGSGVDLSLKDSWDITITGRSDWADAEASLSEAAYAGLIRYVRAYPFVLLAPLALMKQDKEGRSTAVAPETVAALDDARLGTLVRRAFRCGSINLQRYEAGVGGYPYWHCEVYPQADSDEALHRVLLWTLYLNDGFDAGETEFVHQRRLVRPQTGALLIAPGGFTHTHRGNTPSGSDKYIATSWFLFQRASTLFAAPR
jgi:hypothetical protein